MRVSRSDAFIYEKRVKFQVEFPGSEIQFPSTGMASLKWPLQIFRSIKMAGQKCVIQVT